MSPRFLAQWTRPNLAPVVVYDKTQLGLVRNHAERTADECIVFAAVKSDKIHVVVAAIRPIAKLLWTLDYFATL